MTVDISASQDRVVATAPRAAELTPPTMLEVLAVLAGTPLAERDLSDVLVTGCADLAAALPAEGVAVLFPDGTGDSLRVCAASDTRTAALAADQTGGGVGSTVTAPLGVDGPQAGVIQVFLPARQRLTPTFVEAVDATARVVGALVANDRLQRHSTRLAEQLSDALLHRAPVEQAKGVLAERHRVGTGEAFRILRAHARRNRCTILRAAEGVLAGATVALPARPRLAASG